MICPDCEGEGELTAAFVDFGNGQYAHNVTRACYRCKGSGVLPEEQRQLIHDGRRLREFRVRGPSGYQNLVEFGQRFGRTATDISRIERGELPIPDQIRFVIDQQSDDAMGVARG